MGSEGGVQNNSVNGAPFFPTENSPLPEESQNPKLSKLLEEWKVNQSKWSLAEKKEFGVRLKEAKHIKLEKLANKNIIRRIQSRFTFFLGISTLAKANKLSEQLDLVKNRTQVLVSTITDLYTSKKLNPEQNQKKEELVNSFIEGMQGREEEALDALSDIQENLLKELSIIHKGLEKKPGNISLIESERNLSRSRAIVANIILALENKMTLNEPLLQIDKTKLTFHSSVKDPSNQDSFHKKEKITFSELLSGEKELTIDSFSEAFHTFHYKDSSGFFLIFQSTVDEMVSEKKQFFSYDELMQACLKKWLKTELTSILDLPKLRGHKNLGNTLEKQEIIRDFLIKVEDGNFSYYDVQNAIDAFSRLDKAAGFDFENLMAVFNEFKNKLENNEEAIPLFERLQETKKIALKEVILQELKDFKNVLFPKETLQAIVEKFLGSIGIESPNSHKTHLEFILSENTTLKYLTGDKLQQVTVLLAEIMSDDWEESTAESKVALLKELLK